MLNSIIELIHSHREIWYLITGHSVFGQRNLAQFLPTSVLTIEIEKPDRQTSSYSVTGYS